MADLRQDRLRDLDACIEEFDARVQRRGLEYHSERRVSDLAWAPDGWSFQARVRGGAEYTVTWRDEGGELGWESTCSCPVGGGCKHAVAAAITAIQQASQGTRVPPERAPGPAPAAAAHPAPEEAATGEAALLERLAAEHGRALKGTERAVVRRLTRLYSDMVRRQAIDGHEIGRFAQSVNPGLGHDAHVPRELLDDVLDHCAPPTTLLGFWQALAAMFRERGWSLPGVLLPVTDTSAIDQRLVVRRKARELETWTRWFRRLEEDVPPVGPAPSALRRLRLVLSGKGLQFQAEEPSGLVTHLKGAEVNELLSPYNRAQLAAAWDGTSLLLVEIFRELAAHGWVRAATLQDPVVRRCVGRAITHPELGGRILDAAEQPFRAAAGPLLWRVSPDPQDSARVLLELVRDDGSPAPAPLVHVGGSPDLYLGNGEVFRGPPPLHAERPDAAWKASLPASLLHDERVLRVLVRRRAILPEAVAAQVEVVSLRPLIRAQLAPGPSGGDAVGVIFTAVDAAGRRRLTYTPSGWSEHFVDAPAPVVGRLLVPDLQSLQPAVVHFRMLDFHWGGDPARWFRGVHPNTPHELVAWFAGFPADTLFELAPDLAALREAPVRADFALSIEESGRDWFDVELVLKASDTELTPDELELLLKAQGRWVRLGARGWRRLALAVNEAQQTKLAELGLSTEGVLPGRQRYHALQLASAGLEDLAADAAWARVQERARSIARLPPPAAPAGFTGELRPYQHEGFHFLAHLSANSLGGILADDMGLGKTVQALAWLLWLAERAEHGLRALVVCPKSVATNWEREAARFAPSLRVAVFRPREHGILPADVHLVVANYTQLRTCDERFRAVAWTAVILDEGQNIKNPQSQTADVARRLKAEHRIVLTGTPIENRVLDLWSLFAFAMPGLLGGQTQFKKLYDDRKDPTARVRLARRVRHFLLRRTKGQVARELPPRVEEDIICELEGDQRRLYDAELKRARQLVLGVKDKRGFDAQRFNILQSLLRLRQICCHPGLLSEDFSAGGSAKVGVLFEQLETILEEGHKVLIFSQFVSVLEVLQRELDSREIAHLTITGQTENRQELVDRFQTSPDIRVFLLSLKAAGAGLNLTAASYVVLFDPWWNPAVEAQAIDRTHRIGQVNPVVAYRLIAKDTVEEKIRALQQQKVELARAVVQEESLASVMDLEDLRYVLG